MMRTICCAVLAGLLLIPALPGETRPINGIYVVVYDSVITYQEVEESLLRQGLVETLARLHWNQPEVFERRLEEVRQEEVNRMIERHLILHDFKNAGYNLPESFVDDAIQRRILRDYGDRATLLRTLQDQNSRIERYRQEVREQIIVNEMRRFHVAPEKILISPQRIETYYNENQDEFRLEDRVRLHMIVIGKGPSRTAEQATGLAREIHSKLEDGVSFAEMASIYSEGSQRAGAARPYQRSELREELSDLAFSMPPGRHSDVIDLPEACYILKVEEIRTAHVQPIEEVRQEIEEKLKAEEAARLYARWIDRLKAKAFIKYY